MKNIKYLITLFLVLFTFTNMINAQQNSVEIKGNVKDQTGEALIGVTVVAKNQPGLGTSTDVDGNFKLKVGPYDVLVFTYVGYEQLEVPVLEIKDKNNLQVKMKESTKTLDAVVVTASGTQRKATLTGAFTTVEIDQLKSPGVNLSNSLAGVVPGIIAVQKSGEPGADASEFWIRGISTFGAKQSALVLVDGVERNFNEIPVEDIESFSVLKDASATAIYGQRGANGVVLITTKKGHKGKVKINAKFTYGYDIRGEIPEYVDGYQYARLANEARIGRYESPMFTDQELDIVQHGLDRDLFPNVDWQDLMLKGGASNMNANINFSGGGDNVRYYVSGSYYKQDGIYKTNNSLNDYNTNSTYERFNYRANIDMNITSSTLLKVGIGGFLINRTQPGTMVDDIWGSLASTTPLSVPRMYSNGLTPGFEEEIDSKKHLRVSPEVMLTQSGYKKIWQNKMDTNIGIDQDLAFITDGLKISGLFAFDTWNDNNIERTKMPELWMADRKRDANGNLIMVRKRDLQTMGQKSSTSGTRRYYGQAMLEYSKLLMDKHRVGALAMGYFQEESDTNLGEDIIESVPKRNIAYSGRFTYSFKDRYMAEFNWGYTGSENFEKDKRFGFFPAFSVGWAISEEPFVKKALPWLEMFKVRASYGEVGNDVIGGKRFPYITLVEKMDNGYGFGEYNSNWITGYRIKKVGTPNLTWEVAKKYNLGFDLNMFNNMITGNFDIFKDVRNDIFMERSHMPLTTGLADVKPMANVGRMRSNGFDGNIAFSEKVGEVSFTVRGNMTYQKTEVIDHDEAANALWYQMTKGYQLNQTRGYIALGLFEDQHDIDSSPKQEFGGKEVLPGDIKYKDVNGDGIIDDKDKVPLGYRTVPGLQYGAGLSLHWNNFDFSILFQGAGKRDFFIGGSGVHAFRYGNRGNVLKVMADGNRWIPREVSGTETTENPNADWPRLTWENNNNNNQSSTFWMRNGRYLRIKNIELSYNVPLNIIRKYYMENLRIGFIGENLHTWSAFKLWDPENGNENGANYPISKKVSFYVQVSF